MVGTTALRAHVRPYDAAHGACARDEGARRLSLERNFEKSHSSPNHHVGFLHVSVMTSLPQFKLRCSERRTGAYGLYRTKIETRRFRLVLSRRPPRPSLQMRVCCCCVGTPPAAIDEEALDPRVLVKGGGTACMPFEQSASFTAVPVGLHGM